MKRYKLSMVSGAQLYLATSFTAYLLTLLYFSTKCDNVPVAGLTVTYSGWVPDVRTAAQITEREKEREKEKKNEPIF